MRTQRVLALAALAFVSTASANPGAAYLPKIYLGGPDVFYPDPKAIAEAKKKVCEKYGFEGIFPLDNDIAAKATPAETGEAIFAANVKLMRQADLMIANMTPFRGPSMDVGTAYEMGFMHASGKPVLAYTEGERDFTARTKSFVASRGGKVEAKGGVLRDSDGMGLENFGFVDNLMLDGTVRFGKAKIASSFEEALKENAKWLLEKFKAKAPAKK